MIGDMIAGVFGGVLEGLGIESAWKQRARIARREGRVLGSLRVRQGDVEGLCPRWRPFEMTASKGTLSFDRAVLKVSAAYRRSEPLSALESAVIQELSPVILFLQLEHAQIELVVTEEDADGVQRELKAGPGRGSAV